MISRRGAIAGLGLSFLSGNVPAHGRESSWPGGIASLTYDDGLDSHLDIAAPALNKQGLRGTFYVTWENIVARAPEWIALGRQGHEIANHTVHHPCDLRPYSPARLSREELMPMADWLDANLGAARARDFAYPCDVTDLGSGSPNEKAHRYAKLLRDIGVRSARTSEGSPNPRHWVERAPFRLQALAVGFDTHSTAEVVAYLRLAQKEGRWAILVFHDLVARSGPKGTITATDHEYILHAVMELGLACQTVGEVMSGIGSGGS